MNQRTFSLCSEAKDTLESGYITANYNDCAAPGDRFHLLCSSMLHLDLSHGGTLIWILPTSTQPDLPMLRMK